MKMNKRKEKKEDGRALIYYTFENLTEKDNEIDTDNKSRGDNKCQN